MKIVKIIVCILFGAMFVFAGTNKLFNYMPPPKDMPDVPEEVRNTLKFHFVENVDQVLEIALGARVRSKPAAKSTPGKAANGERHKRPVVRTPGAAART